jgi:hypothetical protein
LKSKLIDLLASSSDYGLACHTRAKGVGAVLVGEAACNAHASNKGALNRSELTTCCFFLVQDAHLYRSWAFCASFHVFFVKEYRVLAELHVFKVVVFWCCNIQMERGGQCGA